MTDELKPVRCGCGGEAVIYVTHWWGKCYVCECEECGTASRPCTTEAEAIEAWNRAMGSAEKSSTVERTAKVESITLSTNPKTEVYKCSKCGQYFHRTLWSVPVRYCPSCGARLEWE